MDEIKQRIKIAEYCGWAQIEFRPSFVKGETWLSGLNPNPDKIILVVDSLTGKSRKPNESDYRHETLPDYLYDLNAMHKAEKVLVRDSRYDSNGERTLTQWDKYQQYLGYKLDSTAVQRSEALLKVLNLWE